ncbi:MAG: transporter [Panacagrimonas sp.]
MARVGATRRRIASTLGLGAWLLGPGLAAASPDPSDQAPVTAYRPGAADPAELPVPRFLELELGWNHTRGDDRSRLDSLEYLFKYAFNEDMGLLLGGESYVHLDPRDGSTRKGFGDTEIAWKQRFGATQTSAFGLIAGVLLPTAADGLGEEGAVYGLTGIYSLDIGETRLDVNAGANRYEETEAGVSSWEAEWSAAIGWPLTPELETGLDISGSYRRGEPSSSLLLASLGWELHPRLVLDAGLSYGLNDQAHDLTVFAGMSVSLGRL